MRKRKDCGQICILPYTFLIIHIPCSHVLMFLYVIHSCPCPCPCIAMSPCPCYIVNVIKYMRKKWNFIMGILIRNIKHFIQRIHTYSPLFHVDCRYGDFDLLCVVFSSISIHDIKVITNE